MESLWKTRILDYRSITPPQQTSSKLVAAPVTPPQQTPGSLVAAPLRPIDTDPSSANPGSADSGNSAGQATTGSTPTGQPAANPATGEPADKTIRITAGGQTATVTLADNDAARAFAALVADGPLTIEAHGYGGFEQVGALPSSLPTSDTRTTTTPGDIVLYQGNQICVFHGSNTWAYTLLGHIEGWTDEQLRQLLGNGDATLVFSLA